MSHQQSYRPNVNRAVTRKWAEARHPDYGGDDWGDDGYNSYDDEPPPSAPSQRNPQPWINQERRSFTNPMPQRGPGRASFDQGDERRYFSTSAGGGFESAYPTAQRPPISEPQHDDPSVSGYRQQPSLQLNTLGQSSYPPMHHSAGSGNQAYPNHPNAPFSAPIQPGRRSQSGSRPSTDMYGPPIPGSESRESSSSGRQHPPRKSSLSQQSPDLPMFSQAEGLNPSSQAPGEVEKPLPFIRPADIYKRVEEEREKERRSQDSSRPSIDSATGAVRDHSTGRSDSAKDIPSSSGMPTSVTEDSERKAKPTLDPVPERKSEYGLENILQSANQAHGKVDQENMTRQSTTSQMTEKSPHPTISPISTEVGDPRPAEIPSASSRYTDRVDPTSASTFNSAFPSRMASQQERALQDDYNDSSTGLPEISRMSTFGSDIMPSDTKNEPWRDSQATVGLNEHVQTSEPSQNPAKSSQQTVPALSEGNRSSSAVASDLEHKSSLGYRSAVRQAFENEGQTITSPTASETLPRSNSASTSEISPIFGGRNDPRTNLPIMENLTSQTIPEESFETKVRSPADLSQSNATTSRGREEPLEAPPTLRGTSRRDSPSPARRPQSIEAPQIPEPAQAVLSQESPVSSPHDVRTAEAIGVNKVGGGDSARIIPSPVALGHGGATTSLPGAKTESPPLQALPASSVANPTLHHQSSQMSEKSSPFLPRTHSEEWREWSDARKEFNARHGIKDSNPTTPGAPSSGRPSPLPQAGIPGQVLAGQQEGHPSFARDSTATHDFGLRPSIPGGWQSYNTLPEAETPSSTAVDQPRPPFAVGESRSDSAESIPTATAPKTMDWRAQHTGGFDHPYPEAAAAGSALAGIFSGPALTQQTPRDSENNSIDEPIYGPTGTNQDLASAARDFAPGRSTPDVPTTLSSAATRDFATGPRIALATDHSQTSAPTNIEHEIGTDNNTPTRAIETGLDVGVDEDAQSPSPLQSKAEDFPAPLRTSRSSMSQDHPRASIPSITTSSAVEDTEDSEKLQQDIVKSLTPKTSRTDDPTTPATAHYSSAHRGKSDHDDDDDNTPRAATSTFDSIHRDNVQSYDQIGSPVQVSQPLSTTGYDQLERGTFHEGSPTVASGMSNNVEKFETRNITSDRPFLGQRFSFEDDEPALRDDIPQRNNARSVSPVAQSPNLMATKTRASTDKALPGRPIDTADKTNTIVTLNSGQVDDHGNQSPTEAVKSEGVSKSSPTSPVSIRRPENNIPTTTVQAAAAPSASAHSQLSTPSRSFPVEKVVFRDIMNYSTSRERIQAFNDNRKLFSEPTGQLENWLASMDNSDNAEAFATKGPTQQYTPSSPTAGRTPRRESGAPVGTKQMQEDGKKLLAAAGKYGGKAGSAAKGLFARGKDKLRTVSAGEKATQSNRRRSSGAAVNAPLPPPTIPNSQHSSFIAASAPQIPATQLAMTPLDEGSWSLFANNNTSVQQSKTLENQADHSKPESNNQPPQALSPVSDSSIGQQNINKNFPSRSVSDASDRQVPVLSKETGAPSIPQRNPNRLSIQENRSIQDNSKDELTRPTPNTESVALPRQRHERLHSLSVPQHRRNSSISDVSSVSREGDEARNVIMRTISPSLDDQQRPESTPPYSPSVQTKEEEAKLEIAASPPSLPPYDKPLQQRDSRVQPGAQIIPVARLGNDLAPPVRPAQPRPFSFVGSEEDYLRRGGGTDPTDIENVQGRADMDREKVSQQHNRQVLDEAMRQGHVDPIDQREASKSPLPSARRPPEELIRHRQVQGASQPPLQAPIHPHSEEAYRIPGPYVQEFRSPRQKTSQQRLSQIQSNVVSSPSRITPVQDINPQPQVEQIPNQRMDANSPRPAERSRKVSIGAFFGNRSRSRSRDDPERRPQVKEKRNSLLRLHSSTSEQTHTPIKQPSIERLGSSDRKPAINSMKAEPEAKPQGKKKRFSGLFSKPGNKEAKLPPSRSSISSVQSMGTPQYQPQPPQTPQQQPGYPRGPPSSLGRYQNQPNHSFRGVPPPVAGYYGSPSNDYGPSEDRQAAVSRDSSSHRPHQSANAWSQYQGYQPNQPYSSYQQHPTSAVVEQRPDLRIDTRSHQYNNIMSAPPVANPYSVRPSQYPPQTRANRDISYGQDNYNKPQSAITQHVKDLHMKSRSPRLGPRSSDELVRVDKVSDEGSITAGLGTFMNKKVSPVGGAPRSDEEQEKPWTIGLPGEDQHASRNTQQPVRDPSSASSAKAREVRRILLERSGSPKISNEAENRPQTVADRFMGAPPVSKSSKPSSPSASLVKPVSASAREDDNKPGSTDVTGEAGGLKESDSANVGSGSKERKSAVDVTTTHQKDHPGVAELSGSKPDGYESEEEIVMSATAYPGQEWQPVFERWED